MESRLLGAGRLRLNGSLQVGVITWVNWCCRWCGCQEWKSLSLGVSLGKVLHLTIQRARNSFDTHNLGLLGEVLTRPRLQSSRVILSLLKILLQPCLMPNNSSLVSKWVSLVQFTKQWDCFDEDMPLMKFWNWLKIFCERSCHVNPKEKSKDIVLFGGVGCLFQTGSHYVAQASLRLKSLLSQHPSC